MRLEKCEEIMVEIAYALPNRQLIVTVNLPTKTSIKSAIEASNILTEFPEIDLSVNKVGLFGKISQLDTLLRHKDRVEIYRPLTIDPKKARIKRAENTQSLKKKSQEKSQKKAK